MENKFIVYDTLSNMIVCKGDEEDVCQRIGISREHIFGYWKNGSRYKRRYLIYRCGYDSKTSSDKRKYRVIDTLNCNKTIFKGTKKEIANKLFITEGYADYSARYGTLVSKQYKII